MSIPSQPPSPSQPPQANSSGPLRPLWQQEIGHSLGLALPLSAAQVAQAMTGLVDTIMTGLLGREALAAGGLGSILFLLLMLLGFNTVGAVSPLVAAAYGANRHQDIGPITEQGIWLALFLSVPLTLFLLHSDPFLQFLGQDPQMIAMAGPYLQAIAWGYFPALLFATLRSTVAALSRPRSVLVIMLVAVGINGVANYALMFGKWGFPVLGVEGTGWASTITYWSMALALVGYIWSQRDLHQYQIFRTLYRFRRRQFKAIAVLGLPMGLSSLFESGLFSMATFLAGQLGVTVLAAHQIALQTVALTFMVPLGISQATTVRVGQYFGRQDIRSARIAGYVGLGLGVSFMGLMAIALLVIPNTIISWYLDMADPQNEAVIDVAVSLLAVGGMFQLLDGTQVIAAGALRGLQDTKVPMVIGMIAYWGVGLTTSYLAAFYWGFGGVGLWSGLAIGLAIAAISLTLRFQTQTLRKFWH